MKAPEFDRKFDAGEDVIGHVDWSKAKRPNEQIKRVNVDFPAWVVAGLDRPGAAPWCDPPGAHQVVDRGTAAVRQQPKLKDGLGPGGVMPLSSGNVRPDSAWDAPTPRA